MKQARFESRHRVAWQQMESDLHQLERLRPLQQPAAFPAACRRLFHQLALAEARRYSPELIGYLQQLSLRARCQLYRPPVRGGLRLAGFIASDLPQLVRQHWRSLAIASALLYLPLLLCALLVWRWPDLVYSLLDAQQVQRIESMYDPMLERLGPLGERGSGADWQMFGFYVMNNIGVAFQTFIGGLPAGLGTLFYLLNNAITIGATTGHLIRIGSGDLFLSFVIGHSAFELTAITLAGAAGLQLAAALVLPGRRPRLLALRQNAQIAIRLLGGAVLLLVLAAFTEAYWSSFRSIGSLSKYLIGSLLWLLVSLYFLRAGRPAQDHS